MGPGHGNNVATIAQSDNVLKNGKMTIWEILGPGADLDWDRHLSTVT